MAAGATQRLEPTVWPIPGSRYDPQRLGRIVLISLGALAMIALLLFALRLRDTGEQRRAAEERQEQQEEAAAETPGEPEGDTIVLSEEIIGAPYKDVEKALKEEGLLVSVEEVESDEFEKDAIVETSPPVPTELAEGDAITLFVSSGEPEEEEDEEDEEDETSPPEHSKGKGPKKEKDG